MSDFEDFFEENASTGGGAPSFKFDKIGGGVIGTVVSQRRSVVTEMGSQEPKLDKNGKQQPQLNVVLQTALTGWKGVYKIPTDAEGKPLPESEDDGKRAIYIKHRMIEAVGNACKAAGVKALATGGTLGVKKTGEIPTKWANGIPEFEAKYTAPTASEDFFPEEEAASSAPEPEPTAAPEQDDEPPF